MTFSTAALTILLAMTAFYVFLAVYIVFHLISRYLFKDRGGHQGLLQ